MFTTKNGALVYAYDSETVTVEGWGRDAVRVRATANAALTGRDWALLPKAETETEIAIAQDGGGASIRNGGITGRFDRNGCLTFYNGRGEELLSESWKRLQDRPSLALKRSARELKPIGGSSFRLAMRFRSYDGEKLFGMGQYQMKYLNLKGCSLELAHRNSQASVPFVLSSRGYGFLWNNPAIGKCVFGVNETEWSAESTPELDYWICAGDTPAEIEETYAAAVGTVPMMPDYAMGFWQCKLRYRSQEELMAVARKHKSLGLPMSVIVADFFHWTQQGEYKFDPEYWPDVEGMCRELKELGIELMVSIWPTVDYRSENFAEMLEKGLLVRTERGVRVTMQCFGQEVFIDPTNPETRKFVWDKAKQNYFDKGVRIFWLDEAEPEYTTYDYDNYRYHLGSNQEVGNIYPVMYAKTFFEGMREAGMENPLNLLRCAWAGSAKYGALVWSGDIDSTWECFGRQIRIGLSMGLAGIPWWTTDIGGFHGADYRDPAFHKLLIRWFQWGCFCPVFRLHGCREPQYGFEGDFISGIAQFGSGADNEVWSYGEDNFEIMKKFLFVRERLRPYIYGVMAEAHERGTPVMRPLFYDFPADTDAWDIDDEYMFGPDLLVAPVYTEENTRSLYLPKGARWTCAWSGREYEGGQTMELDVPFDEIPVFLRDGAAVPVRE